MTSNSSTLVRILKCPKCGDEQTTRSHRAGLIDRIYSWGNMYPYRCHHYDCGHRFHSAGKDR
jgi:predicted RNA-binding Zn-ribbon protein involved in translation (DUF1610 family)